MYNFAVLLLVLTLAVSKYNFTNDKLCVKNIVTGNVYEVTNERGQNSLVSKSVLNVYLDHLMQMASE